MSFSVTTTALTKATPTNNVEVTSGKVELDATTITCNKRICEADDIPAGGAAQLEIDVAAFSEIKGIALKSNNPINVQLTGGANPAITGVTFLFMAGVFTGVLLTNLSASEAASVEVMVYGNRT